MRVRFAPSPTGHLHVGNARTAMFNWLFARNRGGALVLRIEDTDVERSTPQSEVSILDDLRWLGLDWDEGPDIGGSFGPYRQSERLDTYGQHVEGLLTRQRAYYCFCSPQQLEQDRRLAVAEGRPATYSGRCRGIERDEARSRLAAGVPAAVRFRVPDLQEVGFDDLVRGRVSFRAEVIGDPIILRSDGRPAYNFAVVVDDALMGITHVVRGEDHISNTPRQVLLYEALGYALPAFVHLALVHGPDHTPLSKRHGATSVSEFRAKGYLPEALGNYLALIGWSPGNDEELLPIGELVRRFSLDAVGTSAGVFDEAKLAWMNRNYMKEASSERLVELSLDYFRRRGFVDEPSDEARMFLLDAVRLAAGSVDRLEQFPERVAFLWSFDPDTALSDSNVLQTLVPEAREVARVFAEELAAAPRLTRDLFREVAGRVRQRTGQKGRALFLPIRLTLMAEPAGPELDLAVPLIERGAMLGDRAGVKPVLGCRERAARFVESLK